MKISEVAQVIDCEHKTAPAVVLDEAYGFSIGTPSLASDRINFSEAKPVSIETYKKWSQRTELRSRDIIMAREAPAGGLGWVDGEQRLCLGQRTVCIRADESIIDARFLFYKLHDPAIQRRIGNLSSGSTVHHINVADIKEITLDNIPSLDHQRRAITILDEIDNSIDVNLKIVSQLEELARRAFDYWFLQSEFPDVNGRPYKSSGGKMIWNEKLNREIPDEWQVIELSKLLRVNSIPFAQPSIPANIDVIDLSVMPSGSFVLETTNSSDNFSTNLFSLSKGDILFGAIRPYLRKAGFSSIDGLVTGTVHSFQPIHAFDFNFALLTLVHESLFKYAIAHSKGTKMPVISSNDLLTYTVAYSESVSRSFQGSLDFMETITAKVRQNTELRSLRDYLIPLVVNGYVERPFA